MGGNQTNIDGDVNTNGGMVKAGTIDTGDDGLAVGAGSKADGKGSVVADIIKGDVLTGTHSRKIDAETYIERQEITGDQAYDVRGMKNPYIGLQAFTYAERNRYAGREGEVADALTRLTQSGGERTLLFVTGASGSGKSSFAQAGLLPALEAYYHQQEFTLRHAVFRPGEKPLAGLAGALRQLNLAAKDVFAIAAEYQLAPPPNPVNDNQISILVIDQFEEIFSQSEPVQRKEIFSLLTSLPPFRDLRMHIIATMRADYLPDLFADESLYFTFW
ncbi:hypothetical protein KFU94_19270 [Chloroflexi bacterium TSY]|nr:hypothetical protein [Chloroflexi bacterium TSY]